MMLPCIPNNCWTPPVLVRTQTIETGHIAGGSRNQDRGDPRESVGGAPDAGRDELGVDSCEAGLVGIGFCGAHCSAGVRSAEEQRQSARKHGNRDEHGKVGSVEADPSNRPGPLGTANDHFGFRVAITP